MTIRRRSLGLSALLSLALGLAGASAGPRFLPAGGQPSSGGGGGGTASACDGGGSGVCADFANGQTFVQWPHPLSAGVVDYTKRFRVYESTATIASGNYTSATLIASYNLPNSGQLYGGDPNTGIGATFTQAHRQANDSADPMAKIPDAATGGGALKTLSYGTDLQVRTVPLDRNAYYAVVQTDASNASPVFLGSVGPIAETAGAVQAIKYGDSLSRTVVPLLFKLTAPTNKPIYFSAHASSAGGGAAGLGLNVYGDYFEWFGDTSEGPTDGRATAYDVLQGDSSRTPSFSAGALEIRNRDTMWPTNGTGTPMESLHFGHGYTPNPLVGAANKFYPDTCNSIQHFLTWAIGNYGANGNSVHWAGQSMGAWGAVLCGLHATAPRFASVWPTHPIFRLNAPNKSGYWGATNWITGEPFAATLGSGASPLGTNPAVVQMPDGTSWNNYVDLTVYATAATCATMPFFGYTTDKDDVNLDSTGTYSFKQMIDGTNALQAGHCGHAFCFSAGEHNTFCGGVIDRDAPGTVDPVDTAVAYPKTLFELDKAYIAADGSSIDDNMGTGVRNGIGLYDGDMVGGINLGHHWTVTSDTSSAFNFIFSNNWMTRSPTVFATATLQQNMASSGLGTFNVDSTAGWKPGTNGSNSFLQIGNEVVEMSAKTATTITLGFRNRLGTSAAAHSIGDTITQIATTPTGPNGGPYTTMTVNMTPRQMQNFHKADGYVMHCDITPFGGTLTTQTPTVINGTFTLTNGIVNSGGPTAVACS